MGKPQKPKAKNVEKKSSVRSTKSAGGSKKKQLPELFAAAKQKLELAQAHWETVYAEFDAKFPGLVYGVGKITGHNNPIELILSLDPAMYGKWLAETVEQTIIAMNADALIGKQDLLIQQSLDNLWEWGEEVTNDLLDYVRDKLKPVADAQIAADQELFDLERRKQQARRAPNGAFGG